MFEHLHRLWKRIERIGSMNLCSTYHQRNPSAPPPEFPSDQEPAFPSPEGPDPDIPSAPPPELPSDPDPVLPSLPNPDIYPYRERWGIYLTQVTPRCSMVCRGGLSKK